MDFDLLPHAFFDLGKGEKLRYARFEPEGRLRGTVLAVPGRREFIEKKYIELAPLLGLGFRLIIVEPRGQGLSSRFLPGDMRQRDYIDSFETHLNDLRAFFRGVVWPDLKAPLIVHGHSMGGHLLLRWLAQDRPPVTGAFFTAPMLALTTNAGQMAAYGGCWLEVHARHKGQDYAGLFGYAQHDYDETDRFFANNPLTHDAARFPVIENYFRAQPDLTVGGVTFGWLLAALRSMHETHARNYLTRIDIPVLALLAEEDSVTPVAENLPLLNRIPRVRTHVIAGSRHDILNEADAARLEAWQRIGNFLEIVTLA